eukprot:TRINITY_DN3003_c0_g1_i1.p1 TRINITY_DN3003_c0_g1~~TRINITY_DN3003_c0_g1_i1.p1  ORF type:complete len:476 (+),score=129.67 TRINITY_DN3003_c0_g1_i1:1272-2699(+)
MNLVTALLLLHMEEEEAFWLLITVVEYILPPDYYSEQLAGVLADVCAFNTLAEQHFGKLMQKLYANGVMVDIFVAKWFLCLYIGVLPLASVLRVLDMFFFAGSEVLFRAALAVLKLCEPQLLAATDPHIMMLILTEAPEKLQPVELVEAIMSFSPPSKLDELRRTAHAALETKPYLPKAQPAVRPMSMPPWSSAGTATLTQPTRQHPTTALTPVSAVMPSSEVTLSPAVTPAPAPAATPMAEAAAPVVTSPPEAVAASHTLERARARERARLSLAVPSPPRAPAPIPPHSAAAGGRPVPVAVLRRCVTDPSPQFNLNLGTPAGTVDLGLNTPTATPSIPIPAAKCPSPPLSPMRRSVRVVTVGYDDDDLTAEDKDLADDFYSVGPTSPEQQPEQEGLTDDDFCVMRVDPTAAGVAAGAQPELGMSPPPPREPCGLLGSPLSSSHMCAGSLRDMIHSSFVFVHPVPSPCGDCTGAK